MEEREMQPSIIVHGGAWDIPPELHEAHRHGTRSAVEAGWAVLQAGGTAMDAVEAAIVMMEDDETFDAGRGSFLNADGQVELDAGCMDGAGLQVGAVASVQFIRNPIRLARAVMEKSEHVLLTGQGAQRFAHKMGFPPCDLTDLAVPREFERWQRLLHDRTYSARQSFDRTISRADRVIADTVGCVALDRAGHFAAGTSTGGTPNKMPGRVGDVPMVGCGFYADDEFGSASCTGWGESIAKVLLARLALHYVRQSGDPQLAAEHAIGVLSTKVNGLGGLILLSADGRPGWHHNTPCMALAYLTTGMDKPLVKL
ncbi:MAG: isoaspartyl peptidase/L-asparaginase [Anaerolineae bacterium]